MSKNIIHSVILIAAILISFAFGKTDFVQYDVQISAFLFIILYCIKRFVVPKDSVSRLIESVIFTLVVLFTVNATGGIHSPFFFLIYFLLFALSLLLQPVISITTTIALIIVFMMSLPENQSFNTLLPLFSLALLTPFALFMGQEYIKNEKLEQDSLLFLSLVIKDHIKKIEEIVDNFTGKDNVHEIKEETQRMEKLIEKYEKSI